MSLELPDILNDPSCLAYWLEFMDRRGRAQLIQFWLTIEGFKTPLNPVDPLAAQGDLASDLDSTNLREDVASLHATYLSKPNKLDLPAKHLAVLQNSFADSTLEVIDARTLHQTVLAAQQVIFEQMVEEDWLAFRSTELFLKASAELSHSIPRPMSPPKLLASPLTKRRTLPPLQPVPPSPARHVSAPAVASATPVMTSTTSTLTSPRPLLTNGSITPGGAITPSIAVSIDAPEFETRVGYRLPNGRSLSAGKAENGTPLFLNARSGSNTTLPSLTGEELNGLLSPTEEDRKGLFDDRVDEEAEEEEQTQRIADIQAALNEIIASDNATDQVTDRTETSSDKLSTSMVLPEKRSTQATKLTSRSVEDLSQVRSSLESTLVSSGSSEESQTIRDAGLKDDPKAARSLFDDEATIDLDDNEREDDRTLPLDLLTPSPGQFGLAAEIPQLQQRLLELVQQEQSLHTLINQAELTGSASQLRILRRSLSSVRRQQRSLLFQKTQYETMEEQSRLQPSRTQLRIPSAVISDERREGKVARYLVEIRQVDEEKLVAEWTVNKRYNDFFDLDRHLRDWTERRDPSGVMDAKRVLDIAEFPGKRLLNVSSTFVESRRLALERYLQVSLIFSQDSPV